MAAMRSAGSATPSALISTISAASRTPRPANGKIVSGYRLSSAGEDREVADVLAGDADEPQAGDQHDAVDHDEADHGGSRLADLPEESGGRLLLEPHQCGRPSLGVDAGPQPPHHQGGGSTDAAGRRSPREMTSRAPISAAAAMAPPIAIQTWMGITGMVDGGQHHTDHGRQNRAR